VPVGDVFVALSGMPTQILARVMGHPVFGAGSCRLVQAMPTETNTGLHQFRWWCRAPESTVEWTLGIMRAATFRLGETSRREYFNHWDKSVTRRWSYALPPSIPPSTIVLAREKSPTGTLYYLCRIVNATIEGAQELSGDWNEAFRLGFGLRALANNSASYFVRISDSQNCEVIIPRFLPSQESMVMRALGIVLDLPNTSLISAMIPVGAWPRVVLMLQALGLSKRDDKL
jgi:hypothetical protein